MFKKAISTTQPLTVLLASAALLIGCSKGGNVPKNWDKDGVGTSAAKLRCASPHAFSAQAVNDFRASKFTQMQSLNLDQNAGAQNALLVIRTILTDLPKFDGQLPSENLLDLPRQHSSMQELNNSSQLIVAEKVNCDQLTAKYRGPGVNGEMIGKLKSISEKSIEIESTDVTGALTTILVEKTVVNRKKDPAGFQKAQQREDNGFTELTVTISRKLNGKDLTGAVIKQKTVMNIEEEVTVNQSVMTLMKGIVGEANIPAGIAQKLNAAQAQTAGLQKVDASNVTLTFSELMSLKKTMIEMRNLEDVNVTSSKVPPVVVIDEVKEPSATQPTPATQTVPAAPPTAPLRSEFSFINPTLSNDSFLQRYLKDVIGNAQKEEKAGDDAAAEAQKQTEAEAAASEEADAADDEATDEEPADDSVEDSVNQNTTTPGTQKTKVPVTATGKIISV